MQNYPRSVSRASPYERSALDISQCSNISPLSIKRKVKKTYCASPHPNISPSVRKKKLKKSEYTSSHSKISIIKTPIKIPTYSPNSSPARMLTKHNNYNTRTNHIQNLNILYNKLNQFEKVYKISGDLSISSCRSAARSSRVNPKFLSSHEYCPDSALPPASPLFSLKTHNESFTLQYCLKNHRNSVNCLSLNRNILYSGSSDYTVKSWKLPSTSIHPYKELTYTQGQVLTDSATLITHKRSVTSIASTPVALFTASLDFSIKLYRPDTSLATLRSNDCTRCLHMLDQCLIGGGSAHITQYDPSKLSPVAVWDSPPVSSMVTRGSSAVYAGLRNGRVKIWDLRGKREIFELNCHADVVTGLDISRESLVSCSGDGCVKFWDLRNNLEVARYRNAGALEKVRVWGNRVVTCGDGLRVWEDGECFVLTRYWCKDVILEENCIIAGCDSGIMVWDIEKIRR